jgi:hypothetical protein
LLSFILIASSLLSNSLNTIINSFFFNVKLYFKGSFLISDSSVFLVLFFIIRF